MIVTKGTTDVTTYFHLRFVADGTDATGLAPTDFDLQYVRSGAAPSTKVDATAASAVDAAHADNTVIAVDATDQPGVYRVDWPDAAFATGVNEVVLTVKVGTAFTESLRVQLTTLDLQVAALDETEISTLINTEVTESEVAILSKLLKYFQLALRKDAAIATDNSTEVTAINADGGSGAGAFANTTDSTEAIRDATLDVNIAQISGDSTAADNLEKYLDGTEFMPVDAHAPNFDVTGTTLTVKAPDGTTTQYTKTVTTDAGAEPITGAS